MHEHAAESVESEDARASGTAAGREKPRTAPAADEAMAATDLWYKDAVIYQLHVHRFSTATTMVSAIFPASPPSSIICKTWA